MKLKSYYRKETLALFYRHVYFHIFTQSCIRLCNAFVPLERGQGVGAQGLLAAFGLRSTSRKDMHFIIHTHMP